MRFDAEIAAIRFGTGLSPTKALSADVATMLDELTTADHAAARFPISGFAAEEEIGRTLRTETRLRNQDRESDVGRQANERIKEIRSGARARQANSLLKRFARNMDAPIGFRERLVQFWADHFTVRGKGAFLRYVTSSFVEDAIRPHILGPFGDLLTAATLHPIMLQYLDQSRSVGPNAARRQRRNRGLNENLARELLELHTLGVDGAYTQQDVRQLAELLAGLVYRLSDGFQFRPELGEPGPEQVLGKSYGTDVPEFADIQTLLRDLAEHPDTARHIARKLAVHFVSDTPDAALVDHLTRRYMATQGDLSALYSALLEHPAAWSDAAQKIKQPFDFMSSSLRALGVSIPTLLDATRRQTETYFGVPLGLMGQAWERPPGPDGWPEDAAAWVSAQGLAARIQWAMTVPRVLRPDLPDPRQFLETALGARAGEPLRFAARAAATKWEGVGLILSSPEFQRR